MAYPSRAPRSRAGSCLAALEELSHRSARIIEVTNTYLNVSGEAFGHEFVEATSDVPRQPAFTACLALLHGNLEHDSDPAVSFG